MIRILCLHIAENQASYRYRIAQFLPFWKEYDIEMHPCCINGRSYLEKFRLALQSGRYDYVWLQRKPLLPLLTTIIAHHSRLIYDYDDAIYARESYVKVKPKPTQPGSRQSIRRLDTVLRRSSMVFAGSEALAEYAKRFNPEKTFIIPTAYHKIAALDSNSEKKSTVTIGWLGNSINLFFLSMIDDATAAIQARFPSVRFSVMSGKRPEGLKTSWEFVPWSMEDEASWLRSIDIGVMPLEDDAWSRGKCAFKLLQYMAYGKPVVASSVGANLKAVIDGQSGFLASSSSQWELALESLISNPEQRNKMGEKSLNHFLSTYERRQVQEQMANIIHHHYEQSRKKQKA
ncbi:MAG: glycosyltransferase family 4 protein [Chlorobiaceae bacterium]|nr:glycosyltransferase family 4 protein [Chlorobiaceae bacterium]